MNKQDLLNRVELKGKGFVDDIQIFDEIDSTNAEAMRQLKAGKSGRWAILAEAQTAGRGRRGRTWLSPPKAGIYLSLVRPFESEIQQLQGLSLVTALSVVEALGEFGIEGLQLKWPNDVLFEKAKLGGILLELQSVGSENYIVFGIGINVLMPEAVAQELDRPVTDLNTIVGREVESIAIAACLLQVLGSNFDKFEESGFSPFMKQWNRLDCYRNRDIVIRNGESNIIGKSLGVDESAALLIQTANGLQTINGGEIFPSLSEADAVET